MQFSHSILLLDLSAALKISHQALHKYITENGFETSVVKRKAYIAPETVRAILLKRGYQYPQKCISIQMLKGGVGKTTTAFNLGVRASMYGARVLFVDLDQQANLSMAMGVQDIKNKVWVHLYSEGMTVTDLVKQVTPHLHIIPSNLSNASIERVLQEPRINVAKAVSQYSALLRETYDLIIIDTAPNLSSINTAAACASDVVIIPVDPDKFAFDGLKKTMSDLALVRKEYDANFADKILFNKFDGRENASKEMLRVCYTEYGPKTLDGFIRTSTQFKNSINSQATIFAQKSTAKEDYDLLAREVLGMA